MYFINSCNSSSIHTLGIEVKLLPVSIIAVIYSLLLPNIYESKALLVPVNQSNSFSRSFGSYSSIAGLAGTGVSLPPANDDGNLNTTFDNITSPTRMCDPHATPQDQHTPSMLEFEARLDSLQNELDFRRHASNAAHAAAEARSLSSLNCIESRLDWSSEVSHTSEDLTRLESVIHKFQEELDRGQAKGPAGEMGIGSRV